MFFFLMFAFSEPMDKAVRVVHACMLQQISQIDVFLGSQGLTIACGASHVYSLIIRDADICNSFSSLLSGKLINCYSGVVGYFFKINIMNLYCYYVFFI